MKFSKINSLTYVIVLFFVGFLFIGKIFAQQDDVNVEKKFLEIVQEYSENETPTNVKQKISLLRAKTKEIVRLRQKYDEDTTVADKILQLKFEIDKIKSEITSLGKEVIPEVIKTLKTITVEEEFFGEQLVSILQEFNEEAVPYVIDALKKAKSVYEKKHLINFFAENYEGEINKDVFKLVKKFLNDKDPFVRHAAIIVISKTGEQAAIPLAKRLIKEKSMELKELILEKLEEIDSKLALPYLDKVLDDASLRIEAVKIISHISGEPGEDILYRLYKQKRINEEEFKKCKRKYKEDITKSNLASLRSALTIYYADNEGVYPEKDLEDALVPKYIDKIPLADVGIEGFPVSNKITYGKIPDNTGGWLYNNDPADVSFGNIIVNCTLKDSNGVVWSDY